MNRGASEHKILQVKLFAASLLGRLCVWGWLNHPFRDGQEPSGWFASLQCPRSSFAQHSCSGPRPHLFVGLADCKGTIRVYCRSTITQANRRRFVCSKALLKSPCAILNSLAENLAGAFLGLVGFGFASCFQPLSSKRLVPHLLQLLLCSLQAMYDQMGMLASAGVLEAAVSLELAAVWHGTIVSLWL